MARRMIMKQILNFIPAILMEINFGIGYFWQSPMLYRLKEDNFPLTIDNISLIGSMTFYGKVMGSLITYLVLDRFGRKKLLILCSSVLALQWIILCFYKTVTSFLITRFIIGMFHSVNHSVILTYASENCYPSLRGSLVSCITIGSGIGGILSYTLILSMEYHQMHTLFLITSLISIGSGFFMVESAEFLLMKNKIDQAQKNFFRIRSQQSKKDENLFQELLMHAKKISYGQDQIEKNVVNDEKSSLSAGLPRSGAARKGLKLVVILYCLSFTGAGIGPINAYTTLLLSKDVSKDIVTAFTLVKAILFPVGGMYAAILIKRFQRKLLAKVGFTVIFLIMLICATLFYWNDSIHPIPNFSYCIFLCFSFLEFICGLIFYPLVNCISGEVLPQRDKALGLALSISSGSIMCAIHTSIFWPVAQFGGIALNFLLMSLAIFSTILYIHFCLPETKDKTLVQIENELQ